MSLTSKRKSSPPKSKDDEPAPPTGEETSKRSKKDSSSKVQHHPTTITTTTTMTTNRDEESDFDNDYQGWTIPSANWTIPTISLHSPTTMTPKVFFRDYIAPRRPVVLRGRLNDVARPFLHWTTNDYLRSKIDLDTIVRVEHRTHPHERFGQGNEISMTFGQFLKEMEQPDNHKYYLTTQDVQADDDDDDDDDDEQWGSGRPDLMAPFMKYLQEDFPLVPELVRSLVPQNINLWMGGGGGGGTNKDTNESGGSSSGLHHDYHDNLYFVIRGTKRFHLFSPKDAALMKTRGKILKVHANGRINYIGEPTTAYGADLKADGAARAVRDKILAEERLIKAEQAVAEGKEGAEKELEAAEEQLEAAMEALLDIEMDNDDDGDGSNDYEANDESHDDDKDSEDHYSEDEEGKNNDGEDNAVEEGLVTDAFSFALQQRLLRTDPPPIFERSRRSRRLVDKTVKDPNNFSTMAIDPTQIEGTKRYPETTAFSASCTVHEGDILYLPASWFHEVVSIGRLSPSFNDNGNPLGGCDGGHMALNYWFHPPDALDNCLDPYSTDFWPNDFRQRLDQNT